MNHIAPLVSAGPAEIRTYLARVLTTKHDIDIEEAKDIASRWVMGRGKDLHKADSPRFEQMFGTTVGPYLWESVYEDMMNDRYNTVHGFISYWLPILSLALGAFYATCIVFSQKNRQENTKRMGFVLGSGLIISGLLNYNLGNWGATLVIIGVVFAFLVCVQYIVVFLDPRKAS